MKSLFIALVATALFGAIALPARAEAGKDCPPVGSLPNYPADDVPEKLAYQEDKFMVDKGNGAEEVKVAGRFCQQNYSFKGNGDPMSILEKVMNFRQQLAQVGAKIVHTSENGNDITARLDKDGKATWIYIHNNGESYITVEVIEQQPFVATLTAPAAGDFHLLGHMPNYKVEDKPATRNYDQATFNVQDGDKTSEVKAQGAYYRVNYSPRSGAPLSSIVETQMNYRQALKKAGAQIVYEGDKETDARFDNKGQTVWVQVSNNGQRYITVTAIEEKPFQATIKPAQAGELKAALDKDGHVALYINFDFDKATLRPDSAPVMAQVLALLKANPGLKLSIVGNTDNVGGHDYNVKLSQQRAAAVVATLVKDGIAATRLKSSGDGPDKPIADNDSSDGRAKNRRVELVKL